MYSGVRSRCPYCGARRIGRGKYSEDSDNARGKMLISVLIMAVLTVGAGTLLLTTPVEAEDDPPESGSSLELPGEEDIGSIPGAYEVPPPTDPIILEPPPPPPPEITSLIITYDGKKREDITLRIGENVGLRVQIEPVTLQHELEAVWTTSDPEIFDVINAVGVRNGATVTGIGRSRSGAVLTVTVGDKEATCIIRVSG